MLLSVYSYTFEDKQKYDISVYSESANDETQRRDRHELGIPLGYPGYN